ncbi:MAG TPA: aminopeptidase P N-terminal domain-containing protein [Myxococcota bacterium]|nr:aminopeptidase P N-terminal domain-containing protein [Myxococcota bacterium]
MPSFDPIPRAELAERRRRFQSQLGEGVAIVGGARSRTRSHDTDYPFRQDSDLWYLTGWEQPEAVAVLTQRRFTFFVQPRDPLLETWNGRRPGTEGAVSQFGADEAYPIAELASRLPGLVENKPRLWHSFGRDRELDDRIVAALSDVRGRARRGVTAPGEVLSPHDAIHELRLRKSPGELELMRGASAISAEAHHRAAHLCRPGVREYELEAELLRVFRRGGGSGPAYNPIVGAGDNATILHYVENRDPLAPDQLVLIDAGVELQGYASDVTRTYPVGGRFQGAARDVYQAVLDAQSAAFRAVTPGVTLPDIHAAALRQLVLGLIALGALSGDVDELIKTEAYRPFYMHSTGHLLGLDVHDVGSYYVDGKPRPLEPGMCFTIEPGLYFSSTEPKSPPQLRGIGVRIEDDVVITPGGYENLTAAIPKEIADVEAWMRS